MKDFIKFAFYYYTLPIFIILITIVPISLRKYNIGEAKLKNAYSEEADEYSWVNNVDSVKGFILGSSSLRYGLSSSLLRNNDSNWINFSMDARDPVAFYFLLQQYYEAKKPDVVLVGLDPWIYSKRYYIHRNKIMYLDLNAQEISSLYKLDNSIFLTKFKQIINYYYLPNRINSNSKKTIDIPSDNGSVKLTETASNFNKIDEDWFDINNCHWSDMEFDYLNRIKIFCHEKKVKLIFIIPPRRKDFTYMSGTKFKSENQQWWSKINNIIGGEYIIGRYNSFDSLRQDSVFAEAFHLNQNGQKIFSDFIRKELPVPGIITLNYRFL